MADLNDDTNYAIVTGRCICGLISLSFQDRPEKVALCHCSNCRESFELFKKEKRELEAKRKEQEAKERELSGQEEEDEGEDKQDSESDLEFEESEQPVTFLSIRRPHVNIECGGKLLREGVRGARHTCRKCNTFLFCDYGDEHIHINARCCPDHRYSLEVIEEIARSNREGMEMPVAAHTWCRSEQRFSQEYRDKYFTLDMPFYSRTFGLAHITDTLVAEGHYLIPEELARLREHGLAVPPVEIQSDREWTIVEQRELFNAAKFAKFDELKALLEAGAPIDCTPYGSQTPAYIAAFYGNLRCLKYLTLRGTDLNRIEKDGFTPAHAAASEGHQECLQWIHENGGDIAIATQSKQTCLSLARRASRHDCISYLESILAPDKRIWTTNELKKVFDAAKEGKLNDLMSYIEQGAPVDTTPYGSQTPMYISAFYGQVECMEYLISKGAELDRLEKDGFTPAHAAASEGQLECLKKLYRYNSNLSYATSAGQTCYSLAKRSGKISCVRFLESVVKTHY